MSVSGSRKTAIINRITFTVFNWDSFLKWRLFG